MARFAATGPCAKIGQSIEFWTGPRLVEQALTFAMGFLAACLIVVVGIPAISRRATRLSEARARLRAPATEKQASADRDALRAQNAVERVRLERRLALVEVASNQRRVEVGRQTVKILALESAAAEHVSVTADQNVEIARGEVRWPRSRYRVGGEPDRAQRCVRAAGSGPYRRSGGDGSPDRTRDGVQPRSRENCDSDRPGREHETRLEDLTRSAKAASEKAEATRTRLTETLADRSAQVRRLESQLRDAVLQNERLSEKHPTAAPNAKRAAAA